MERAADQVTWTWTWNNQRVAGVYETKKTLSTDTLNLAAPDREEEKLPINQSSTYK